MAHETSHGEASEQTQHDAILMPAPTFWPIVFAFGLTLLFAGLVTQWAVSAVGLIIALRAVVGWWFDVIPHEAHEEMPINKALRPAPIMVEERSVVRLQLGESGHRIRIPEKVHPYSSGIWGGLAGGAAMAALAILYGLIAQHSIWYPVNLLAGVVFPNLGDASLEQLRAFHLPVFLAACAGHLIISCLVGVVYAVMLPMFPKYAPFWAGILMPLFWSGLVATTLNILNPALNDRISWPWFVVAQLGFGLVGGYVIARSTSISTMQSWSMADRAFLQAPSANAPDEEGK
jgi:hypothetical protein